MRSCSREALTRPREEWDEFLAQACDGDEELRQRLRRLLEAHENAGEFLVDPTVTEGRASGADELEVSTTIGPYKILQKIGEGGYGLVFMAEQLEPVRRKVALKILKAGMDTRQVIARFEAERQALAMMDHPNIATVFDAGQTNTGRPYFVMELVQGIPITEFCDQSKVDPRGRLQLFLDVCAAVHHAHQKGIIHRDLKPSNVLVTLLDGIPAPKIIDFGIAKATQSQLTDKTLFTDFLQFVGTPAYVSPEQAEMSSVDVDTRADVYSLGILLYELLTGTTPFDARQLRRAGLAEIQRIIRDEEPPRPSMRLDSMTQDQRTTIAAQQGTDSPSLRQLLSGDLDWVVLKAIEKERSRRYGSVSDMARDVGRFLADEPIEARPPTLGYRLGKFVRRCRRHKAATAFACLSVAAIVVGMAAVFWQWRRAETEATRATYHAREETEQRERIESVVTEMELQRVEDLFRNDLADEALAYLARVLRREQQNRQAAERLVSALTFRSFALPTLPALKHSAAVTEVAWSPDGSFIATASDDKTVVLWDAVRGVPRLDPLQHGKEVRFVRISPDSRRLLSSTAAEAILWDAQTGEKIFEVDAPDGSIRWVEFSP